MLYMVLLFGGFWILFTLAELLYPHEAQVWQGTGAAHCIMCPVT